MDPAAHPAHARRQGGHHLARGELRDPEAGRPLRRAPLEAILFDNDGVLVDTEGLYFRATRELLASVGIDLEREQFVELSLRQGRSVFDLAERKGIPREKCAELRARRNARYSELLREGDPSIPGMKALVAELAGRLRLGLVTSSRREHLELAHRASGMLRHFEFTVAHGDYAETKPAPDPYLAALARAELPAERCLAIEDSERGLAAALAAGLECWVLPGELTRGAAFPGAARILSDPADLRRALEKMK